ncbi:hypothetical protein KA005_82170, partial [bacterium]|nr:hypothetical protein [bacterium]
IMRCPYCKSFNQYVTDSRPRSDNYTWRRRKCLECGYKFTTYERIAKSDVMEAIRQITNA